MAAEDYFDLANPPEEDDQSIDWDKYWNIYNAHRRSYMPKKNNKINKFYVGAKHIAENIANGANADWSHSTIEAAVKHAKEIMDRDDLDCTVVVEIIRIIRREKSPVRVEKV